MRVPKYSCSSHSMVHETTKPHFLTTNQHDIHRQSHPILLQLFKLLRLIWSDQYNRARTCCITDTIRRKTQKIFMFQCELKTWVSWESQNCQGGSRNWGEGFLLGKGVHFQYRRITVCQNSSISHKISTNWLWIMLMSEERGFSWNPQTRPSELNWGKSNWILHIYRNSSFMGLPRLIRFWWPWPQSQGHNSRSRSI
jgi:hypothetical protein